MKKVITKVATDFKYRSRRKAKAIKAESKHIGSDFDDFLREEGMLEEATAVAIKRVIAYQLQKQMERDHN